MAITRFVATINPSGVEKLTQQGARTNGRQLVFFEDDEKSAHIFYRRYMRNFFGVVFHAERDYSIYEPKHGTSGQRMGFQERTS